MLFGFTGASRSGKTTLANAVSEELGIHFHPTQTSKTAREFGFEPLEYMTLRTRLDLQKVLLREHLKDLERLPRPLLIDRTPLDYAMYLLCEFNITSHKLVNYELLEEATAFVEECKTATACFYDVVIYLDPLATYQSEEGKHAANPIFQKHSAIVTQGLIEDIRPSINYVKIFDDDMERRVGAVRNVVTDRIQYLHRLRNETNFVH